MKSSVAFFVISVSCVVMVERASFSGGGRRLKKLSTGSPVDEADDVCVAALTMSRKFTPSPSAEGSKLNTYVSVAGKRQDPPLAGRQVVARELTSSPSLVRRSLEIDRGEGELSMFARALPEEV